MNVFCLKHFVKCVAEKALKIKSKLNHQNTQKSLTNNSSGSVYLLIPLNVDVSVASISVFTPVYASAPVLTHQSN